MADTKTCPKCHIELPLTMFYMSRGRPSSYCKECHKTDSNARNVSRRKENVIRTQMYREQNPTYANEYMYKRYRSDPVFNITQRIRSRIGQAIRNRHRKTASTKELLGCDIDTLYAHIEAQFLPGMTWDNRREWHIDHIIPLAAFDLTTREGQRRAFHYTNLQPLWAVDNLKKGAKV